MKSTAKTVAEETGVSPSTIDNDVKFAKAWSVDLQLENKKDIEAKGIKKMSEGGQAKVGQGLLQNNKPSEPAHRTREEIAKAANVSPGTVAQAEQVKKKAPELCQQ